MSRRPALFTEADIKRAYRAAAAAGLPAPHIEITRDGTLRIIPNSAPPPKPVDAKKRPVL